MSPEERLEVEAAAFRRLVQHLRSRADVQNVQLMQLAGFCRNSLAEWYKTAAADLELPLGLDEARESIYGMPYADWKARHQNGADDV